MKFITQNFGAKIIALLCAVFLWAYVSAGETKTGYFPGNLPLEAKNIPEGLAAVYDQPKLKIKIQAPYETWGRLGVGNFSAYIDLSEYTEGTYDVEVKVSASIPSVNIVEIEPSRIIVRLEPKIRKELPVKVRFEGEAKVGFVPGEVTIKPETADINGAKSLVSSLSEVTALVRLSGEDADFEKSVILAVYDENNEKVPGLEFDPQSVDVMVPIVPASEGKSVGIKAKTRGKPKSDFYVSKIEVSPATIEVFGASSTLKSLLYIETKEVNIDGISKDFEKDTELSLPSGITVKENKIKVKIYLSQNSVAKEITASLNYQNLITGLSVSSVSPSSIKVLTSCPVTIAGILNSDKVIINFNLEGRAAGSFTQNINKEMLSVPDGCAVASWLPSAVTITLQ